MCFNKERFAELLGKAKGDRSLNQFALHADVSSAHVSRLMRQKLSTPPSPETIKKLASKAHNGVTYELLMEAAGHWERGADFIIKNGDETIAIIEAKSPEEHKEKKPKDLQKFLDQQEIMFDGVPLTDDDKEKIRKALEIIFWDAKQKNKRKKS